MGGGGGRQKSSVTTDDGGGFVCCVCVDFFWPPAAACLCLPEYVPDIRWYKRQADILYTYDIIFGIRLYHYCVKGGKRSGSVERKWNWRETGNVFL